MRTAWLAVLVAFALSSATAAPAPKFQRGEKASVLIFTTTDCPIANAMLPELARLQEAFVAKGVSFTLVHVDPDTTLSDAQEHAKSYKVKMSLLIDAKHELVKRYHATRTPEAFVILPDDTTVYHGRINDLYHAPGQRRRSPSANDLKDALAAVVSGRPVPNAYLPAVGCVIADFAK